MKDSAELRQLNQLIKDIKFAMLTTVHDDGALRSRPMATQEIECDGDLWFFTQISSQKVHDLMHDRHVNLSYASSGDNRYVSVSGIGEVVRDRAKMEQLWSPIYKTYFPKGLDDPDIALLRVSITGAEYWEASLGRMQQLIGFVKAVATGEQYRMGENKKINVTGEKEPAA